MVETRTSTARPAILQADAAVLGQALLGDIELGHDLDARDDQRRHGALGLQHLAQHAVDAEAHDQAVLERLDMDVRGVFLHRLGEHRVDEPDDRRVVVGFQQVGCSGSTCARCVRSSVSSKPPTASIASGAVS